MISFSFSNISQQSHTGILINQHVTVQAAADVTGFNIEYLRRLLRSGTLEGLKIDQMWLIDMGTLENVFRARRKYFRSALRFKIIFLICRVYIRKREP